VLQPELIVRKPLEMFQELPLHVSVTFASGARDCRCYRIEREGDKWNCWVSGMVVDKVCEKCDYQLFGIFRAARCCETAKSTRLEALKRLPVVM
jgi:hypothetical protein